MYIEMALSFLTYWQFLLVFACFNPTRAAEEGITFYQQCQNKIGEELAKFTPSELKGEIKLVRVYVPGTTDSYFYPRGKRFLKENQLFEWTSQDEREIEQIIVTGIFDENSKRNFEINGWMPDTFVALKIVNETLTRRNIGIKSIEYYALVVYARKDLNTSKEIELEWDRWSLTAVNFFDSSDKIKMFTNSFQPDTFLCSYGTCACGACQCEDLRRKSQLGKSPGRGGPKASMNSTGNPSNDEDEDDDEDDEEEEEGSKSQPKTTTPFPKLTPKPKPKAVALAFSQTGQAAAASNAKGKADANSFAISKTNTAFAKSVTNQGKSASVSNGTIASIAEAQSRTGNAQAKAITLKGFAQSSSQTYGGGSEAQAHRVGKGKIEDTKDDESTDDMDGESIFRDTLYAFGKASDRSNKHKPPSRRKRGAPSVYNCDKEYEAEANVTRVETLLEEKAALMHQAKEDQPYKNPSRYGIYVEVGVNTSVYLASKIQGYTLQRKSCCSWKQNRSTTLGKLIGRLKQDCSSDMEPQAARLEKASNTTLNKILTTTKLTVREIDDLIPLIFLKIHKKKAVKETAATLNKMFAKITSSGINFITSLILQASHFASNTGHLHRVKIYRGLSVNIRAILTGLMLETKKCKYEKNACDSAYLNRIKNEKRLIVGLYLFLKFADSRFYYSRDKDPVLLYIAFMKIHVKHIESMVHCKSKRVVNSNNGTEEFEI